MNQSIPAGLLAASLLVLAVGCAAHAPTSSQETSMNPTALEQLTDTTSYGHIAHLPIWPAITPEIVEPGVRAQLDEVRREFEQLESNHEVSWDGLMVPLESMNDRLGNAIGRISHLLGVDYSDELQQAYDAVRPAYIELANDMSQSVAIYGAMKALAETEEGQSLSEARSRILSESIRAMERSGVHLQADDKARYQALSTQLSDLSTKFRNNLVAEEKESRVIATSAAEVAGVPKAILDMAVAKAKSDGVEGANSENGPWHFVVNGVNYAVVQNGENRDLRERFLRAFRARGTTDGYDNTDILLAMLKKRQELAALVGFANYADYSLDAKMAPDVDTVWSLFEELEKAAKPAAIRERAALVDFIRAAGAPEADDLQPWDVAYWAEKQQQALYGYDSEALREYFPLPIVVQGLFELTNTLYGVTFEEVTDGSVPLWHEDVRFYQMLRDGEPIAGFYFDPYARPGAKRAGAWMNTVVDRSARLAPDGMPTSLPVGFMIQNARPPADGKPALMSLAEVRTLFHEFGHLTQLMFTRVEEAGVSGINLVEWDTVEVASQFNEFWMDYPPFLEKLTSHVDTGEHLDRETIDRIIDSRTYMAGNGVLGQLVLGKTDLRAHERYGVPGSGDNRSPFEMEQDIIAQTRVMPSLPGDSFLHSITHLFAGGYAAGYFSYKWAEVMAADAFSAFEEVGLDNSDGVREVAQRFEDTVLSLGGSKPAAETYRLFRGRDATPEALLRSQGLLQGNG
ncbi:MAG: M3 family metallopeptidase [Pseudomonadaceae bacterium]|nr:M3 family metallopeptidase [Pseudomonadaceae bacterium]